MFQRFHHRHKSKNTKPKFFVHYSNIRKRWGRFFPRHFVMSFKVLWMSLPNLHKVNNGNTRTMCEIPSKTTMKTSKPCQWRRSYVFINNFELSFTDCFSLSTVDFEQINSRWVTIPQKIVHQPRRLYNIILRQHKVAQK